MKKIIILSALCLLFAVTVFAQADKSVSRHVFATAISDREPVDNITSYTLTPNTSVYYFSELMNMQGMTVKHVWSKNDTVIFELPITVNGSRWRVSSSMKSEQFKAGDVIKVEVVGDDGRVYATDKLDVM